MPPCSAPPVVRVPQVNLESTSLFQREVKPLQPTCHILLCSYRAEDGQDVLDAWHSLEWQRFTHCEITHLIFSDDRDLLDIMILLDQVRHGFFTAVFFFAAPLLPGQDCGIRLSRVRYHFVPASALWG